MRAARSKRNGSARGLPKPHAAHGAHARCSSRPKSSPKKSSADLRSANQAAVHGQDRDDFCAARFRADTARLEDAFRKARKRLTDAQEEYAVILETQEAEHFDWLSGWHQRLLSAISSEKLGSQDYPGWKAFKQLALKSTEEVVEAKHLLEQQVLITRGERTQLLLKEELQARQKDLNDLKVERQACAEEVRKKKLQKERLKDEEAQENKRWAYEMSLLEKRRDAVAEKNAARSAALEKTKEQCRLMREEIKDIQKKTRPMFTHVYKFRMERLKAELMEQKVPLFEAEKALRDAEAEKRGAHFEEMEELRSIHADLKRKLDEVQLRKQHAASRTLQSCWRQRQRRKEVARRTAYFEDIQQEAPEEEIPQETPEDIQEEIGSTGFDHPPERLAVVGAPIAGDVSVDKSVKKAVPPQPVAGNRGRAGCSSVESLTDDVPSPVTRQERPTPTPAELGESSPGSRSVRTEESVADDAVESADIEEVVEPADTNPEPKDPEQDGDHKKAAPPAESTEKAPDGKEAIEPANAKLEPKETPIPPAEFGESSPGSRSVRTEESVADDAVESADIEEVVEPADTNPESKDPEQDADHKKAAELADAKPEPKETPVPPAESTEKAPDGKEAIEPANAKLEPKETPIPPAELGESSPGSRSVRTEESVADDAVESADIEEVVEPAETNPEPKDPDQDGDHKKAAELADAKPEPKETPVPPAESTEKAPDGKEAIEPANAKLEPKETPIPPAELGESSPGSRSVRTEESVADDAVESADIEEVVEPADTNPESKDPEQDGNHKKAAELADAKPEPKDPLAKTEKEVAAEPVEAPIPTAEFMENAPSGGSVRTDFAPKSKKEDAPPGDLKTDSESHKPHEANIPFLGIPRIEILPPDQPADAGEAPEGQQPVSPSQELPGDFLSPTFNSSDLKGIGRQEDSLWTEESPCSPDGSSRKGEAEEAADLEAFLNDAEEEEEEEGDEDEAEDCRAHLPGPKVAASVPPPMGPPPGGSQGAPPLPPPTGPPALSSSEELT